jgi:hypothetical protein
MYKMITLQAVAENLRIDRCPGELVASSHTHVKACRHEDREIMVCQHAMRRIEA